MSEDNTLTVRELIRLLKRCDPNLPVASDGCDCTGEALDVVVYADHVLVSRSMNGLRWNEIEEIKREAVERALRKRQTTSRK